MIRTKWRIGLSIYLLAAILAFIWGNSLMPGAVSQAISDWVQSLLFGVQPKNGVPAPGNGLLRKVAHFTEFAALGMNLAWLFGMLQKKMVLPLSFGVGAAIIDETIQAFVPERAPRLLDVCIDSAGVLTGIVLLLLGHTYLKKKRNRDPLEDK